MKTKRGGKSCQEKRERRSRGGCLTCKVRRVKCDEDYPVCQRCVSTGRTCDGYGILRGGGGNSYGLRYGHQAAPAADSAQQLTVTSPLCAGTRLATVATFAAPTSHDEWECFEWFRCRTAVKLRGAFVTDFWTSLLLQASLSEPAVFHAVIALGTFHRGGCDHIKSAQQLTLRHYIQAIRALQRHFTAQDRAALRVTLLVCIMFVSLDLLRGHFVTAEAHLDNGLRLLEMLQLSGRANSATTMPTLPTRCGPVAQTRADQDIHFVEVLTRLHVQFELFRQPYPQPSPFIQACMDNLAVPAAPWTLKDAWIEMDRVFLCIFRLQQHARRLGTADVTAGCDGFFYEESERVKTLLSDWLTACNASAVVLRGNGTVVEEKAHRLLLVYHTMQVIMADACLHFGDEGRFDAHTSSFVSLIRQLSDLWALRPPPPSTAAPSPSTAFSIHALSQRLSAATPPPDNQSVSMSRSIVDMGWVAPLYYVAVKCRVHRIRLQAVRLLEASPHREGIWDSHVMARVGRKVMELEEQMFYQDECTMDDSAPDSPPTTQDICAPPLPCERRICDVRVVLSGEPLKTVSILGHKWVENGVNRTVCLASYDMMSQQWDHSGTDVPLGCHISL